MASARRCSPEVTKAVGRSPQHASANRKVPSCTACGEDTRRTRCDSADANRPARARTHPDCPSKATGHGVAHFRSRIWFSGLSARGLLYREASRRRIMKVPLSERATLMRNEVWTAASSWGAAGSAYERFSEHFADALHHCAQRLAPRARESILDVATGTGWTARLLASRAATVSGVDYSEELITAAKAIARDRRLGIAFEVGDAHDLPYADHSFDGVCSTFGVIFASDPELAARELGRVCRPRGRLALAVWAKDCVLATMAREVFTRFSPPPSDPPPPSPYAWGSEDRMRELLEPAFDLYFERGCSVLREPDGDSVWRLWEQAHGLTVTRLARLDDASKSAFRDAFIDFHERFRTPVGIAMPRDYIVAVGTRR